MEGNGCIRHRMTRGEDFQALAWLDENLMTREALSVALETAGADAIEARMLAGSTQHAERAADAGMGGRKGNFLGFWQDYGVLHAHTDNGDTRELLKRVLMDAGEASGIRMPSDEILDILAWMRRAVWREDMGRAAREAGLDREGVLLAERVGFDRMADLWSAAGESLELVERLTDGFFIRLTQPGEVVAGRLLAQREAERLARETTPNPARNPPRRI